MVDDRVAGYGHLIVDECHHLSAQSFELVARQAKARFVTGLSATVARKDGHHPIIFMQCGPVCNQANAKVQAAAHPFGHDVFVQPTAFMPNSVAIALVQSQVALRERAAGRTLEVSDAVARARAVSRRRQRSAPPSWRGSSP